MNAGRRAARLASLYPEAWRRRFPDFEDVLAAVLAERPRGVVFDVVRGAVSARWGAGAGAADRGRSGVALVYAALLPFVGLAAGMWSQLHSTVAGPGGAAVPALRTASVLLAATSAAVLAAGLLAAGSALVLALRRRTPGRAALHPALALAATVVALSVAGWAAEGSGWYSPAAAGLPGSGLGHVATWWIRGLVAGITPAWVHPALFGRMPAGELSAALSAPVGAGVAAFALLRLAGRLAVPSRATARLAAATAGAMLLTVAAAVHWLVVHPARSSLDPGHTAWTVVALLGLLAVAASFGTHRVVGAGRPSPLP